MHCTLASFLDLDKIASDSAESSSNAVLTLRFHSTAGTQYWRITTGKTAALARNTGHIFHFNMTHLNESSDHTHTNNKRLLQD